VDQNDTTDTGSGAARPGGSAWTIAVIALVVALTAPFWEEAILGSINIHLPLAHGLAENTQAIDALDRKTTDLDKQATGASAQLAKVQADLASITTQANAAAAVTRLVATVDLASALRRQGGFALELYALRAATPDLGTMKPLLDQIEPYAVTGVPSADHLRQDFSRISGRLSGMQQGGFAPIAWVSGLWPWHRAAAATPGLPPDPTPQLVAQANQALSNGDLPAAVDVVQQIGGANQEVLADWIEDAKARVAADAVARRLGEEIMQRAGGAAAQKPVAKTQ
jgi:hypothetical protein